MTEQPDLNLIQAAQVIHTELPQILATDAPAFAAELQVMITAASELDGELRSEQVDRIVTYLSSSEPIRLRLAELVPAAADLRGVTGWAPDLLLAGEQDDDDQVRVTCSTCKYVNHLAYRPPEDAAMPVCQNKKVPEHPLGMA
jgi:hypothetical protein